MDALWVSWHGKSAGGKKGSLGGTHSQTEESRVKTANVGVGFRGIAGKGASRPGRKSKKECKLKRRDSIIKVVWQEVQLMPSRRGAENGSRGYGHGGPREHSSSGQPEMSRGKGRGKAVKR